MIKETGLSRVELLKRDNGGRFGNEEVDAFVDLWRLAPVLSTMLMYWTCYSQVIVQCMPCLHKGEWSFKNKGSVEPWS